MLATKERGATLRREFNPDVDEFTYVVHVEFRALPFAGMVNREFSHTYYSESAALATFNRVKASEGIVSHACIIVNAYRDQEFQWEFVPADWRFRR